MTVYYMQDGLANYQQSSKVTAFRQGFRQLVGEAAYRTKKEAQRFRQITYTCLETMGTRFPEVIDLLPSCVSLSDTTDHPPKRA